LAPEEIYSKQKTPIKGTSEVSSQEKKGLRRARKDRGKKEEKQKVAEKKMTGKKMSKKEAVAKITRDKNTKVVEASQEAQVKTSTGLFKQLQEESQKEIQSVKVKKNDSTKKNNFSSSSFKLN